MITLTPQWTSLIVSESWFQIASKSILTKPKAIDPLIIPIMAKIIVSAIGLPVMLTIFEISSINDAPKNPPPIPN